MIHSTASTDHTAEAFWGITLEDSGSDLGDEEAAAHCGRVAVMGRLGWLCLWGKWWENDAKMMGKCWENIGRCENIGTWWADAGTIPENDGWENIGKWWETDWTTMGKWLEWYGNMMGKYWTSIGTWLEHYGFCRALLGTYLNMIPKLPQWKQDDVFFGFKIEDIL